MVYPLQTLIPAVALFPILWGKVSWSLEKVGYNDVCKVTSRKILVQEPTLVAQEFDVSGYEIRKSGPFSSKSNVLYSQLYPNLKEPDRKPKTDFNTKYFHYSLGSPDKNLGSDHDLEDQDGHVGKVIDTRRIQEAKSFLWGLLENPGWGKMGYMDKGTDGINVRAKRSMDQINTFQEDSSTIETANMGPSSTISNETPIDDQSTRIGNDLSSMGKASIIPDTFTTDGSLTVTEVTNAEESTMGMEIVTIGGILPVTTGTSEPLNQLFSEATSAKTLPSLATYESNNAESTATSPTIADSTYLDTSLTSETFGLPETATSEIFSSTYSSSLDAKIMNTDAMTSNSPDIASKIPSISDATTIGPMNMISISDSSNPTAESPSVTTEPDSMLTTMRSISQGTTEPASSVVQSPTTINNDEQETSSYSSLSSTSPSSTMELLTFTTLVSNKMDVPFDNEIKMTESIVSTQDTREVSENSIPSTTIQIDMKDDMTTIQLELLVSTAAGTDIPPSDSTTSTMAVTNAEDPGDLTDSIMTSQSSHMDMTERTSSDFFSSIRTTISEPATTQAIHTEMATTAGTLSSPTTEVTIPSESSNSEDLSTAHYTITTTIVSELNPTEKSSSGDNQICDDSLWLVCDMNTQHCKCKPGMIYDPERNICVSLAEKDCQFGASGQKLCVKNAECSEKEINQQGICKCIEGFLPTGDDNGNCLPGLNMPCETSSDGNNPCHPDLECSSKKCICRDGFIQGNPESHRCYLDFNANCSAGSNKCNAFSFMNCSESTNTCKCQDPQNQVYETETKACAAVSGRSCMIKNDVEGRLLKCVKNSNCNKTTSASTSSSEMTIGICNCVTGFENDWRGNCFLRNSAISANISQVSRLFNSAVCVIIILFNLQNYCSYQF